MRRLRSIARSTYIQSIALRVTGAGISFLASIFLARLLGPTEFGKYGILLAVATVLAIPFSTGLSRAITKETAEARVTGDTGRIPQILKMGSQAFFILLIPLAILAGILYFLDVSIAGITGGIIIAAALAPLLAADANRIGAMQGMGSAIGSQIPDQIVRPVAIVLIVTALLGFSGSADAILGATAYSAAALFSLALGGIMLRKLLRINLTGEEVKTPLNWGQFTPLLITMSVLGGSKVLMSSIDLILLNWLGDLSGAGHYKVALAGFAVAQMGTVAIQSVVYTRIAATIPVDDTSQTLRTIDGAIGWQVGITTFLLLLIITIGQPMITLLYGIDYVDAWPILVILSSGALASSLFGPSEEVLMLKGRQLLAASIVLIGVGLIIALALVLGPRYGTIGVAIAYTIGSVFRAASLMFIAQQALSSNPGIFGTISRKISSTSPS